MTKKVFISNALDSKDKIAVRTIFKNNFPEYTFQNEDSDDVSIRIVLTLQFFQLDDTKITTTLVGLRSMEKYGIDFSHPIFERKKILNLSLFQKKVAFSRQFKDLNPIFQKDVLYLGGTVIDTSDYDFIVVPPKKHYLSKEINLDYIQCLANNQRILSFEEFIAPEKKEKLREKTPLKTRVKKPRVKPDANSYKIDMFISQNFSLSQKTPQIKKKGKETLKETLESMKVTQISPSSTLILEDKAESQTLPNFPWQINLNSDTEKNSPKKEETKSEGLKLEVIEYPKPQKTSYSLSQKTNPSLQKSQKSRALSQKKYSQDPSQKDLLSFNCFAPPCSELVLSQSSVDKNTKTLKSMIENPSLLHQRKKEVSVKIERHPKRRSKVEKSKSKMIQRTLTDGSLSIPLTRNEKEVITDERKANTFTSGLPRPSIDDIPVFATEKMANENSINILEEFQSIIKNQSPRRTDKRSDCVEADSITIFSQVPADDSDDNDSDTGLNLSYNENNIKRSQSGPYDSENENEDALIALLR